MQFRVGEQTEAKRAAPLWMERVGRWDPSMSRGGEQIETEKVGLFMARRIPAWPGQMSA